MARVVLTEQEVGDARDAGPVNTNFTNITTQSSNIDGENFREEGIDEYSMVRSIHADGNFYCEENTGNPGCFEDSTTTLLTVTLNAAPATVTVTLQDDEACRIRGCVEFYTDPVAVGPILWGIGPNEAAEIALIDNAVGAFVSERGLSANPAVGGSGTEGSLSTFHYIHNSTGAPVAHTFELRARKVVGGGANYRIARASLIATVFSLQSGLT